MTKKTIPLLTLESRLKRKIRTHFRELGYTRTRSGELALPDATKDGYRKLHRAQRKSLIRNEASLIKDAMPTLKTYFAEGHEIEPLQITPRLEPVFANTWQSRLFRLASLTWSVPVSAGYGRRMRFLVWDTQNEKLIGLIGLGDPVFNVRVRDNHIGWSAHDRGERLVNLLDAFVLGSVPPYNMLLGGKLVASLVKTLEIKNAFNAKYRNAKSIISKKRKRPELVAVTTSSALGRSSVYNRLRLANEQIFQSVGFTTGWGHFHISDDLFSLMREYLASVEHGYFKSYEFGEGSNWKLRAIKGTLQKLNMNPDLLKHGITREVFICELAGNARQILKGERKRPNYEGLKSVAQMAEQAKDRWVIPRAIRDPRYRDWRISDMEKLFLAQESESVSVHHSAAVREGGKDGARKPRYGAASPKGRRGV